MNNYRNSCTTVRRNFLRQGFNCLTSITYKAQNIFRLELRNFAAGNKMPSASHEQRKNNLRAKDNMVYDVIESMPVDKNSGVLSDETMRLIGYYSIKKYPDTLRLIVYEDFEAGKVYHFLTNNFSIEDPLTIAELYRERWQIELFFKWNQTAFAYYDLLRNIPERRLHANPDSRLRLSAAHHCKEEIWSYSKSSFHLELNRTGALQKS